MFLQKLRAAQQSRRSLLCVGLDPTHSDLYDELRAFLTDIIDATADYASAFKPNLGFFLSRGTMGLDLLSLVMERVPNDVPVILDAKFGDIGSTAEQYAKFAFEKVGADAVTLSPYIGTDALTPFLAYPDKGIFALCRTSNVAGNEFQPAGTPPLYEQVARRSVELSAGYPDQIGLVVGATQLAELAHIREIAPALPFLIPGVGAQGGDLRASVLHGQTAHGVGAVINIGRAIIYASLGEDYAQAAAAKAKSFRDEMNQYAILSTS
jgi:orotidine-5'-phosphate decarboxylase